MSDILGIIFANDDSARLGELTTHRATASIPFCGRYRLVDFTLSSFVNSGVTKIGIITKNNYSSLMDHIRMGRDWDLNRKNGGIAVFPPYVSNVSRTMYKGKIDAIEGIVDYVSKAKEEYVILANGDIVANIDYKEILDKHIENKADVTIVVSKAKGVNSAKNLIISKQNGNEVKEVLISNEKIDKEVLVGLNIYIMKVDFLLKVVNEAYQKGYSDLERELFQRDIAKYKVCSYELSGYVASIDDISKYYQSSMQLLRQENIEDVFYKNGRIFTKVKDSVPVRYGKDAKVSNSLVADGCVIEGHVENSILFRNVVVEKGAVIKDSIIMEYGYIQEGATVNCAITDKNVSVKKGRVISGHITYPVVIAKGKEV